MQKLKRSLLFFILCCFSSCTTHKLAVQTRYFSQEDLASFYVGTPDPLQNNPPVGQSLIFFWNLSGDFCRYQNVAIHYKIRFFNREEVEDAFIVYSNKLNPGILTTSALHHNSCLHSPLAAGNDDSLQTKNFEQPPCQIFQDSACRSMRKSKGYFTYYLFSDDYFKKGGIATYKAELIGDGEVLEEWRHHLWKELTTYAGI